MIEEQSIEEISSNIQIGILKSEDVVKSYLEKIEKYNSDLNAIISLRSESEIFTDLKKNEDQFKENQIFVHSDDIEMKNPIRTLGEHEISVSPYLNITHTLKIKVNKN